MFKIARFFIALWLCVQPFVAGASVSTPYYYFNCDPSQDGYARAIAPYLDVAYTTPRNLLGQGHSGAITIYFEYNSDSGVVGSYLPGKDYITLNLGRSETTPQQYSATVAHETTHLLFEQKTHTGLAYTWLTEALAYYVDDTLYPYGERKTKSDLQAEFRYYSYNGRVKTSWQDSGWRYVNQVYTDLDLAQLHTIGYFLADSSKGSDAVADLTTYLARGYDVDRASRVVYWGLSSGQYDTATGRNVATLYSQYYYYYTGHY